MGIVYFYSAEKDEPPHVHVMSCGAESEGGIPVSATEITMDGFWIHSPKKDYYISRKEFTWFVTATEEEIRDVVIYPYSYDNDTDHGDHLRWKSLDIDLGTHTIEHPELYPRRSWVIMRDGKKIYIDTDTGLPLDPQPEQE
ncbi:MAG: DUF4160 domain-containing protein [Planctomycetaceae bacterium]|nr:DUF4160 domain-containing protein [Planctomycetaceae bacterium]